MNIAVWLERIAKVDPARPAIFLGHDCVADYGQFHNRAAQFASWLAGQGVQPGDRVAIFMTNCPDYLIAMCGIWYAGAVIVPINAKLHGREAAWIIENAGASFTVTSRGLAEALLEAGASGRVVDISGSEYAQAMRGPPLAQVTARAPTDLAWLFYTSGTTGRPKGVMITHRMLIAMSLAYHVDVDPVRPCDATLYAAPMSHGAGIYAMLHVQMGARHVCPISEGFDEAEILDLARHHRDIHLFAAPTMVKRLTDYAKASGATGEGLRSLVYAGGPMYLADIIEAVDQFGDRFIQIYGQGECPMSITALSRKDINDRGQPRWRERLGSVGRAQSVVEVMIGGAEGHELPRGTAGEIMVRGDTVMPGYWNNPEATAKTLVNGWLLTGDVGHMDEDGYVTLQDRSKDMIISGGSNIYPREVEEVLLTHPSLSEVSVVGRKSAEWGEDVVAFVVLAEGAGLDREALDTHCLEQIARFKRPKDYFVLPELPKNNYGKVLKTELRARLHDG